jgi:hypothetical protein
VPDEELDFLPPRLDAPGEFAIFAARSFDIPFSFSFSYCFSFFTFAFLPPGISDPLVVDADNFPSETVVKRARHAPRALLDASHAG